MRQESWSQIKLTTLALRRPGTLHLQSSPTTNNNSNATGQISQLTHTRTEANAVAAAHEVGVAQSYEWLLTVINHFCGNIYYRLYYNYYYYNYHL